jgi:hypothetical protein
VEFYKTGDGVSHTDTNTILNEQVAFYRTVFTSKGWNTECGDTLLNNVDTVITDDENTQCDRQITEKEVKHILGTMKQGSDGIVAEMYVIFKVTIKHEFSKNNELCKSQYHGVITRIYKQGDREDIKNSI